MQASRILLVVGAVVAVAVCQSSVALAETVAYWRFEEGPADAKVVHSADNGVFYPGVTDSSGNGNALSAWTEEDWAAEAYRTDVPLGVVPVTGAANNFSVQNTGGAPGMWTQTGSAMQTMTPAAFTIEASFKPQVGGWKTLVGRDSQGAYAGDANLSALYFQITDAPNNGVAIKFCDVSGYWHEAISPAEAIQEYPEGDPGAGRWYHMAAVSDGSTLSLYLADVNAGTGYQRVAQTDMTASGSPNTALTAGMGDGTDWDAGNWTVGRGMYAGGHGDRVYGFIDEVRISDTALDPSQFLFAQTLMTLAPYRIDAAPVDAPRDMVLAIPSACNATQAVDVTVTSDTPAVAKPAGSQGSAVVNFAAGAPGVASLSVEFGSPGQALFTLSATGGCPAAPGPAAIVNVHALESVDLRIPNDVMRVGLSQQAGVIASFGPAGTRDLAAASFGTTYTVVPEGVVTVSPDGLITAVNLGTATITATYDGLTSPERIVAVLPPDHTVAYWRFEAGPDGAQVPHGAATGTFWPDIPDSSGNGNALSAWTADAGAGEAFRADVASSIVTKTGAANNFSIKNTGGYPGLFTGSDAMRTMTPAQWTVEASFKPETGGYRTIVGRDSYGTASINSALAALYFQIIPGDAVAIKFTDVAGYWHEAISANGVVQGFPWSSDPDGLTGRWYHMAAVSDGSVLSLYLDDVSAGTGYQLVAQTDLTASGSPNTALTAGAGSGGDWQAGNWSVMRGLYNGGHVDRGYGFVDEVRISDVALDPGQFLFMPDYMVLLPNTIEAAAVDTPTVSLVIPTSCNESQAVDVTITSDNPAVAKPAGSEGSAVLHFAAGAGRMQPVTITLGSAGQAQFTLSATGDCAAGPGAALTVTVYAADAIDLQAPYDLMQVGQIQQAEVVASFGPAGTRTVTAASLGTTYQVVPSGILDVGPDGQITALALGEATVTATYNGLTSQQTILVTTPGHPRLSIAGSGLLLVDLSAEDATAGQAVWRNKGSLGDFTAIGQPVLETVDDAQAVTFSGDDAYQGSLAPPELLGGQGRTIEVWAFNPVIECSTCIETMVAWGHRGGPCGSNLAFGFGDHEIWGGVAGWCDNGDIGWNDLGGSPPLGEWRYLVYTYDPNDNGGTTRLYDNGVQVNSEMSGPMPTNPGHINLAVQNLSAAPMDLFLTAEVGALSLAAVRVHDGALTQAEIEHNYRAGITGRGLLPPDLNLDTYVDGADVVIFNQCAGGPEVELAPECEVVDFDLDGDGDQDDFGLLQRCYAGSFTPASADCMD